MVNHDVNDIELMGLLLLRVNFGTQSTVLAVNIIGLKTNENWKNMNKPAHLCFQKKLPMVDISEFFEDQM